MSPDQVVFIWSEMGVNQYENKENKYPDPSTRFSCRRKGQLQVKRLEVVLWLKTSYCHPCALRWRMKVQCAPEMGVSKYENKYRDPSTVLLQTKRPIAGEAPENGALAIAIHARCDGE